MGDAPPKKFWRIGRKIFRWTRIFALFALFLVVFAVVYLHEVGLPGFVKRPILDSVRDRGFAVQFSDMRWAWPNHVLIEQPAFAKTNDASIQMSASAVDLTVNLASATKKQWRIESFSLTDGRLILPISRTNDETLILTNIQATIRISSNKVLRIEKLDGEFDGAALQVVGTATNFLAALDWDIFHRAAVTNKPGESALQSFAKTWRRLKFTEAPRLVVHFSGDAVDVQKMQVDVDLAAKSRTETPWAVADNLHFRSRYGLSLDPKRDQLGAFEGRADRVQTSFGMAQDLTFVLAIFPEHISQWRGELSFAGRNLQANWPTNAATNSIAASKLQWKGSFTCSTNLDLQAADGHLEIVNASSSWGAVGEARGEFAIGRNPSVAIADATWGYWKPFVGWTAKWQTDLGAVITPQLEVTRGRFAGDWSAPELTIRNLDTDLYGGSLKLTGKLDVNSREVNVNLKSDFDVHKIMPLLPAAAQRWLKKFEWEKPPHMIAEARAILPTWTNQQPNWKDEVLPSLQLLGNVTAQKASYRAVPVVSAMTTFVFSNMTWTIPDLHVVRPEGAVDLSLKFNKATGQNHWLFDSRIDPKAIKPWFSEDAQAFFDKVQLAGPPTIHAEIVERGFDFSNCGLKADVLVTNIAYRGLELDRIKTSLTFSNNLLAFFDTKVEQGEKVITCPNAEIDIAAAKVSLHEVYSTMEPMPVTRAIGRKVAAAIEPYQFHKTPTVYVEGSFVFDHPETGDMHFIVEGEQFEWGVLKADKATAKVDWIGETLYITNITASAFRGGSVEGWVFVDFKAKRGNDFKIGMTFTNLDLQSGMLSLGKTNRLEGTVNGKVNLTAANTKDRENWEGFGWMQLHDGFVWEVPIFGLFSPVLNAIVPGTGSSRAREASASFIMTNSVIHSDDLEIRSPAVRISYRGDVDLNQQVNAIVEAQLLRDAGSIGHIVSIALQPLTKVFEYKLTGSLEDPKSEPVFIPNILMKVLRPFHTLKKMLPEKAESSLAKPQAPTDPLPSP